MIPPAIQKIIDKFSDFPTVGPRTAARFALYLIKMPQPEFSEFIKDLIAFKKTIRTCQFCCKSFEPTGSSSEKGLKLCEICSNPSRDRTLLCVVERETDLNTLESTKKYNGLYYVLGGVVANLKKDELVKMRIQELRAKAENPNKFGILDAEFKEILIATNPTTEGEATRLALERILKPLNIKMTRLGRGLPIGGELEYADEETLTNALEGRK